MAGADIAGGVEMARGPEEAQVKIFSFFQELADPFKKLAHTAWRSRGKLAQDVKAYVLLFTSMVLSMPGRAHKVVSNPKLHAMLAEEEDPQALAAVIVGSGGALCLGSVGAVIGATAGAACGLCLGALPALFTFGLSLPVGAVVGGVGGMVAGAMTGSTAGFAGGATSGCFVAYFRTEIRNTSVYICAKLYDVYDILVLRPAGAIKATNRRVCDGVRNSTEYTKAKAQATATFVKESAADRRVQVSAAGAGLGATACGTAGAATGACIGGSVGALVGLVPAVFTFGLSIPIGAVVGGSAGVMLGGAVGTSAGFAGGGAMAFLGFTYRSLPAAALEQVKTTMKAISGANGKSTKQM
eukprot:CAMPEP_0197635874 /NCGR_PEP_ID=MMETSP1338-20131121/11566_1 /TAXON_ID=43686 ORGANISM="Pelagodinium beii, Strain RCC1491" /NCGR_SAMPLE_ID=MMETSP1338 /ASSEMBLY_ACC=CAM_ASM_000754 /LENGTH=354 /DNA_ID=CAMNT_0043208007 /DNA_START=12 /DNA_END=1076 /DNA_ORIENTATION=+